MAGAGRRTFTPGEVLTASNVMNYLQDQAVMNFAGTAARGSAIGTAVSEGMVSYLADSNVVQAYDGSAWNSLAYASSVITPGLVPIVPTSVNLSAGTATISSNGQVTVASGTTTYVRLNGVFTDAYDYYVMQFEGTAPSAEWINFQLSNGGVDTTSNYNLGGMYVDATSIGFQTGALSAIYGRMTYMGSDGSSVLANIFGTRSTTFPVRVISQGSYGGGTLTHYFSKYGTASTTFDGIKIMHATSTFTNFRVQVYGGKK